MKVMITGGAGYIGNELVYRLAAQAGIQQILIYDNLCKGNYNLFTGLRKIPGDNVQFVQADILDSRSLRKHMEGMDVVYHLAARVETPYADQNAHDFEQTNHWGTAEVVYAAEELGIGRLIYVSSASVYGEGITVDTAPPMMPTSFYSLSKLRGEDHVKRLMDKMPVQLIRLANVYGYSKNLRIELGLNQLIFDAHFKGRIAIHGDLAHRLSYISLYRTVEVLAQIARTEMASDVYNLSHRSLSQHDIIEALKVPYPELETIFVDQHIPLKELSVASDPRLEGMFPPDTTMVEDILKFQALFTF